MLLSLEQPGDRDDDLLFPFLGPQEEQRKKQEFLICIFRSNKDISGGVPQT